MDYIVYDKKQTKETKSDLENFISSVNEKLKNGYKIYGIYPGFFHLSNSYSNSNFEKMVESVCLTSGEFESDFDFFDEINRRLEKGFNISMCQDFVYDTKLMRLIVLEKRLFC